MVKVIVFICRLNMKLRSEVEAFNMRCSKCGVELDEETINGGC